MDKKAGTGCTVVLIVGLILAKVIKEYQSQIIAGLIMIGKIFLVGVLAIFALWLLVKWVKKSKEKREEQQTSREQLQADEQKAMKIKDIAKVLIKKIEAATNIDSLVTLQKDCSSLNPVFNYPSSPSSVESGQIAQYVSTLFAESTQIY